MFQKIAQMPIKSTEEQLCILLFEGSHHIWQLKREDQIGFWNSYFLGYISQEQMSDSTFPKKDFWMD